MVSFGAEYNLQIILNCYTLIRMKTPDSKLHIAIIPDGNRRWAKKRTLSPWKGHEKAIQNFKESLEWCYAQPEIGVLTIWCFSTENWKRSEKEIDKLMKILEEYLINQRGEFIEKGIRILHSGRKDRLPASLIKEISKLEEETKDNKECTLNLAIDYGGKDEILRAIKKSESDGIESEDQLKKYLDQPDLQDPDLIIRTSGENRTSNFFLWQSAYAEWMFLPILFPDFGVKELEECVNTFKKRSRRFGS